jgi:hypothetical protein
MGLGLQKSVRKQLTEAQKWPIIYLSPKPGDVGVALTM